LGTLLEQGDFDALALLQDHAGPLRAALGPGCEELAQHIRLFDFKAAEATLLALRESLGTG
jgi:hypothetical protein